MNKELTPLEAFQLFCKELKIENSEFARTIETALKRLELYESNQIFIERAKKLKALEIIKEKEINVALLKNPCVSLKEYNVIIKDQIGKPFRLTQEEFDSLKEVLS